VHTHRARKAGVTHVHGSFPDPVLDRPRAHAPWRPQLWDLRTKEAVHTYKAHKAGVTHVHFSPDCKWVASGSTDGCVKVGGRGHGRVGGRGLRQVWGCL